MIKERLLALPNEIWFKKLDVLNLQERAEDLRELMNLWELKQLDDISNAVDDKGKAVFSNDTKRKIELEKRKQNDKQYQNWLNELRELEHKIAKENLEIERLFNEQGNLRALCKLEGISNDV